MAPSIESAQRYNSKYFFNKILRSVYLFRYGLNTWLCLNHLRTFPLGVLKHKCVPAQKLHIQFIFQLKTALFISMPGGTPDPIID